MKFGSNDHTPNGSIFHTHDTIADIPCTHPEKHQAYYRQTDDGKTMCWLCIDYWQKTMPWNPGPFNKTDEEAGLFAYLNISNKYRKSRRFSRLMKDYWVKDYGPEWAGYTVEYFGIELGEFEEGESLPIHPTRMPLGIPVKENPKLFIWLLRARICYEPTMREYPLYLEAIMSESTAPEFSIRGLAHDLDISAADIRPLLKARDHLLRKDESPPELNELSTAMEKKARRFMEAARLLGKKREPFKVSRLLEESKMPMGLGYKSRNTYYRFLQAVTKEKGREAARKIQELTREQYELGLKEPKLPEDAKWRPIEEIEE